MNYKKLAFVAMLSAASSTVIAGGFDGPFVQAGIGLAHTRMEMSNSNGTSNAISDDSLVGQLSGGYSKSFGQFNLAGSVFYDIGKQKAGSQNMGTAGQLNSELKNTWGVSIEPGWNINPTTLAYAKFSYVDTDMKRSGSANGVRVGSTHSLSGFGYGLGIKHLFTKNWYGYAEIQKVDFDDVDSSMRHGSVSTEPKQITGFVGAGYRF
ncbi:MAG: outer membrane beta-barrel protein [Burkholderiaceae bacterium]|nr:outer membrane beta-barrel protein [Burkholderiaceae bacterium]